MTILYLVVIFLQVGVIVYFLRRGTVRPKADAVSQPTRETDSYEHMRVLAFGVTPAQLQLAIPETQVIVYGVIMDWNTGEMVVTLAAYITGAVNLYLSTGGGVPGGGKNPDAGDAAVEFVVAAQDYLLRSVPIGQPVDLPPDGCVRFYLLSNKGNFAAQEQVKYFDEPSSDWLPLFQKANEVISRLRQNRPELYN